MNSDTGSNPAQPMTQEQLSAYKARIDESHLLLRDSGPGRTYVRLGFSAGWEAAVDGMLRGQLCCDRVELLNRYRGALQAVRDLASHSPLPGYGCRCAAILATVLLVLDETPDLIPIGPQCCVSDEDVPPKRAG